MKKMSIDSLQGISPVAKIRTFPIEKNGEETSISFRIYPFTVKEKIQMKNLANELEKMDKNSDEYKTKLENQTYETICMILSKSVEDITPEYIRENIPQSWFEDLLTDALSFEGVSKEDLDNVKKKNLSHLE